MNEQQKLLDVRVVQGLEVADALAQAHMRQAVALEHLAETVKQALPLLAGLIEILAEADTDVPDVDDDGPVSVYLDGTPRD